MHIDQVVQLDYPFLTEIKLSPNELILVDLETNTSHMANPTREEVMVEIVVAEVDINREEVVSIRETVIGELFRYT